MTVTHACVTFATCATLACASAEPQAHSANAVALASNAVQTELELAYRAANKDCVDHATSVEHGHMCFELVDIKWKPIWQAREEVRLAHQTWTAELVARKETSRETEARFVRAWCHFREVIDGVIVLPTLPIACSKDAGHDRT